MTRDSVLAAQQGRPPKGVQMIPITIKTVSPLIVTLPGGGTAPGVAVAGLTYTVGAAGWALWQEPALGPVFPSA